MASPLHQLRTDALSCIRDDRILFEQLTFSIETGELLQVAGPNGSGKTSLLRILCGLSQPESGEIYWNNQNIHKQAAAYHQHLLYIGHQSGVKGELTAEENLRFLQALHGTPNQCSISDALVDLGLRGFEDVPVRTLSAGQQRRVALARLRMTAAPLWILDEPFTALDQAAVAYVESILEAHAARGGLVVMTSHHQIQCQGLRVLVLK